AVADTAKSASPKLFPPSAANVIVWPALATANVCDTSGAGKKLELPPCEADTVHDPAPVRCTVDPLTVQFPVAPNETGSPDDAQPLPGKSASPNVLPAIAPKLIDCDDLIVKLRETLVAALKFVLPPCDAVTVHEPPPVTWTFPETIVHWPLAA